MGGWGRQNPWPLQWGGGQSPFEKTWKSLRAMLGPKGPGPIDGLEDAWRESKVSGLVKVLTMAERAATQAFPIAATDSIPVYEEALGISPARTDQQRRESITVVWSGALSAVIPDLVAALQLIDDDLDIIIPNEDDTDHAARNDPMACWQLGQAFRAPGGAEFGQYPTYRYATAYPNYSTNFICYVLYDNQPVATGPDPNKVAEVERVLCEWLPGWCDYVILTSVGFLAGSSPVGWTGLSEEPNRDLCAAVVAADSVAVSGWSDEGNASDAVAVTDSVERWAEYHKLPFSWSAAIDSVAVSSWSDEGNASDSLALGDGASAELTAGRSAADAAAVTDSVSRTIL